jgi:hypothetical protein
MEYPPLTIGICTYKRPWYACQTIQSLIYNLGYAGPKRFIIADGGSPQEDIEYYLKLTKDFPTMVKVTNNLSDMVNSCAQHDGEVWLVVLDDFMLSRVVDVTPDVRLLLEHPEIGSVRMSRLAMFGNGDKETEITADLILNGGLHWWRFDKQKSNRHYMITMGFHLYHRRFWDAYGDIRSCDPKVPGQAELWGNDRYYEHEGPTIAIPVRFGQDCLEQKEPVWHFGVWRTDDYASTAGSRW